jgi:hypothetical protein
MNRHLIAHSRALRFLHVAWIMAHNKSMIETTNLRLVPCDVPHFEVILNDPKQLEQMLGVTVTEGWSQFPEAMQFGY